MARLNVQYTLVGFSPDLDWRPLFFVKPLPQHRLCGACGLVRKKTAFLPCMHVLCECCYEQCAQEVPRICPLDGVEFCNEDVEWRECPSEELLRREVTCWNKDSGCHSLMPASEVSHHFQHECGHHCVCCPKCSITVLCTDVCSHMRAGCSEKVKPLLCKERETPVCGHDKAFLANFRSEFEKEAAEIKAILQRLAVDDDDRLNEILAGMITFKEAFKQLANQTMQSLSILNKSMRDLNVSSTEVKECLTTGRDIIVNLPENIKSSEKAMQDELANRISEMRDHLTRTATAIEAELKANVQLSQDKTNQALQCARLQITMFNFMVRGVEALQQKAVTKGLAWYYSKAIYLRGYCMSPGVCLKNDGQSVKLCPLLCLNKGAMDKFVRWPFGHKCRLSVVHPRNGAKVEVENEPNQSWSYFQRPTASRNEGFYFCANFIDFSGLMKDGYVLDDTLQVQWELLP